MDTLRQQSLIIAGRLGYPTNPQLPTLDKVRRLRSLEETIARICAMHCVAAAASGFDRRLALSWVKRASSDKLLASRESAFLEFGRGDRQVLVDQVEGILALAWAIGIAPAIDFGMPCPNDFVTLLPDLRISQDGNDLRTSACFRSLDDVDAATDLAYCLHWAIRDAQLKVVPIPGKVVAHVVIERRYALEWLRSDVLWDEVQLDT